MSDLLTFVRVATKPSISVSRSSLKIPKRQRICHLHWIFTAKKLLSSGASPPDPLTRGSAPKGWTPLGHRPQNPVIGSLALSRSASVPRFPLLAMAEPLVRRSGASPDPLTRGSAPECWTPLGSAPDPFYRLARAIALAVFLPRFPLLAMALLLEL